MSAGGHAAAAAQKIVAGVPHYPRRRHRRRRRRYIRKGDRIDLPLGARVYAPVERQENDPDGRRRVRWEWCEIIALPKSRSATIVLRPEGLYTATPHEIVSDVRADMRSCVIRSSAGNWMRLSIARDRCAPDRWWWHGYSSCRRATELEVAFYADGFVPHEQWRLNNGAGSDEFLDIAKPEKVWLAKPEPPTDEEIADAKEKKRTKKREGKLAHAHRMLAMWQRHASTASARVSKWKAAVKRLEKGAHGDQS